MENLQNKYILDHTAAAGETLRWLEKQTNLRTNYPQMLCGPVQGLFLGMIVKITGSSRVLEIGTFTGYSAICIAQALPSGGHLDTLEINDEMEDLIREGWLRSGVEDRITLHIGDALETLKGLTESYDMVYMDANKRQYCEYYELSLPLLRTGGVILADDVLMGGKVCSDPPASDPQTKGLIAFNDLVSSDPRVESVILPVRDGLTLIRKK